MEQAEKISVAIIVIIAIMLALLGIKNHCYYHNLFNLNVIVAYFFSANMLAITSFIIKKESKLKKARTTTNA